MTATMSTCEHARSHPRSNSHAHAVAHKRAFAKILAHTRVRAQACQCTGRVRCGRYCYFSALKILVVFLQTHGFVLAFRDNYNVPIYRLAPARQR